MATTFKAYNKKLKSKLFNITIDGFDVIGEDISPNESFNRRETSRKAIIGGTESVIRTSYIRRDWSFKLHFQIDPEYPDVYDDMLRLWQSKPVEVISKELGGKFNAEVIVKRTHSTPRYLDVDVQVIEIPSSTSLIPNDTVKVPTTKVTTTSSKNKNSKKNTKKNTKTSKKTTKKTSNKNTKKKGSNITKVSK